MLLFSPKARRVIGAAIADLPDAAQRQAWLSWSEANPQVRVPEGQFNDGKASIPTGVAAVALAALEQRAARLKDTVSGASLDEDQLSDLENDLTFIANIESLLVRSLGEAEAEKAA